MFVARSRHRGRRATKWLQRAGAPPSRYKFCLQHGLREFDWLPSLLSKDGRDAAKRDRSLRALLLMWSHSLRKRGQEAAKCILEDILRKVESCLLGREFPVAEWAPGPRAAGRDSSSPEPGGCDAQPLAAQSVVVPLSAGSRADAAHLASLMLALEVRDCQSSSAWLCRVLDWVSEKIDAFVIGESIATSRYDDVAKGVADLRGKSGNRRRVDPDALAQAEADIAEGMSRSLRDTSRQKQRFSLRTAGRRADTHLLACKSAARACFANENRVSIAFDGTELGCEGTLGTCIYSFRKRKFSWLIPKVGRFFASRSSTAHGWSLQSVISQSSASHHSGINQSSVSHQSVISGAGAPAAAPRGNGRPRGSYRRRGVFCAAGKASVELDRPRIIPSVSHQPIIIRALIRHQSFTSQPSAGRGAEHVN